MGAIFSVQSLLLIKITTLWDPRLSSNTFEVYSEVILWFERHLHHFNSKIFFLLKTYLSSTLVLSSHRTPQPPPRRMETFIFRSNVSFEVLSYVLIFSWLHCSFLVVSSFQQKNLFMLKKLILLSPPRLRIIFIYHSNVSFKVLSWWSHFFLVLCQLHCYFLVVSSFLVEGYKGHAK